MPPPLKSKRLSPPPPLKSKTLSPPPPQDETTSATRLNYHDCIDMKWNDIVCIREAQKVLALCALSSSIIKKKNDAVVEHMIAIRTKPIDIVMPRVDAVYRMFAQLDVVAQVCRQYAAAFNAKSSGPASTPPIVQHAWCEAVTALKMQCKALKQAVKNFQTLQTPDMAAACNLLQAAIDEDIWNDPRSLMSSVEKVLSDFRHSVSPLIEAHCGDGDNSNIMLHINSVTKGCLLMHSSMSRISDNKTVFSIPKVPRTLESVCQYMIFKGTNSDLMDIGRRYSGYRDFSSLG